MIYAVLGAVCFTFAVAFVLGFWFGARSAGKGIAERLTKATAVQVLRDLKKGKRS